MTKKEASRGRTAGSDHLFARDADRSPTTTRPCVANDVTALLNSLAGQMEQSERRQTAAILDVKARLEALQHVTTTARDRMPSTAAATLDRAEASLAVLAEQVAAAGRERAAVRSAAQADIDLPTSIELDAVAAQPPVVPPRQPVDPDNPWDADDAETLAAIYHPLPVAPTPSRSNADADDELAAGELELDALADQAPAHAAVTAGLGQEDRGWLEQRLAAMAGDLRSALEKNL
jgi:hypothetical protein